MIDARQLEPVLGIDREDLGTAVELALAAGDELKTYEQRQAFVRRLHLVLAFGASTSDPGAVGDRLRQSWTGTVHISAPAAAALRPMTPAEKRAYLDELTRQAAATATAELTAAQLAVVRNGRSFTLTAPDREAIEARYGAATVIIAGDAHDIDATATGSEDAKTPAKHPGLVETVASFWRQRSRPKAIQVKD